MMSFVGKFLDEFVFDYPKDGHKWGNWTLDAENRSLDYKNDKYSFGYRINLESLTSSAPVLDWIAQVSEKTWATREDIGYLVQAFDEIFGLQGSFCGVARDKEINAKSFFRERY
jgi:hypothetical protein